MTLNISLQNKDIIIIIIIIIIIMLMDVAISGDRNVIKKETEKILNIKTLQQKFNACGM